VAMVAISVSNSDGYPKPEPKYPNLEFQLGDSYETERLSKQSDRGDC